MIASRHATSPSSQPYSHRQNGMLDKQTQAATAQIVGCEGPRFQATGASLSVTRTIGTSPPHGLVMRFNFTCSRRLGLYDTNSSLFRWRSEGRVAKQDLAPPFLCANCPPKTKNGAGFQISLVGRGKERDTGRGSTRTN